MFNALQVQNPFLFLCNFIFLLSIQDFSGFFPILEFFNHFQIFEQFLAASCGFSDGAVIRNGSGGVGEGIVVERNETLHFVNVLVGCECVRVKVVVVGIEGVEV